MPLSITVSPHLEVVKPIPAFATYDTSIERIWQIVINIAEFMTSTLHCHFFLSLAGLGHLYLKVVARINVEQSLKIRGSVYERLAVLY